MKTKLDFEKAVDFLIEAAPRNNNKGKLVKEWFSKEFNCSIGISHITEDKAKGNRVKEQFNSDPIVVFVCNETNVTINKITDYIKRYYYNKLETVLLLTDVKPYKYLHLYEFVKNPFSEWASKEFNISPENLIISEDEIEHNIEFESGNSVDSSDMHRKKDEDQTKEKPLQQIFYGAPGTGKSHKIKDDANVKIADAKNLVFRTTFHPDSDYSTFVGAYKPTTMDVQETTLIGKEAVPVKNADGTPKTEKKIIYEFVPQAFLQACVAAWNNPDENVYLVIEEINRGNCAQIFGDLFQLLDRDDNGESEYPIMADRDLAKYLLYEKDENNVDVLTNKEGIKDGKLKLPKNLYIWATMNTSDQSLFPIDSAFKRRWDWEYMPIGYKNDNWIIKIGEKKYRWVDFQRKINDKIYSVDNSEDKQLGDYFVNADRTNNVISSDTLLNKILFYLWNDVCKDDPEQIFRWKDDQDNDKEKGIKFSEFFCVEKERKLQGFMAFLGIDATGNVQEDNEDTTAGNEDVVNS